MATNFGDGTNWSSERGNQSPRPEGNSGNNDRNNSPSTPQAKQIAAVQSDPVVRDKLSKLLTAVKAINPSAKVHLLGLSPTGTLSISIDNIDVEQASTLQLSGMLFGLRYSGGQVVFGDLETGHKLTGAGSSNNSGTSSGIDGIISNVVNESKPRGPATVEERAAKLYSDRISRKALVNMYKETKAKGAIPDKVKGELRKKVQMMLDEDKKLVDEANAKKITEKELLMKTADLIQDAGEKISGIASAKFKSLAKEIADNVRNFQGKNIRSFNDAMKTLNRLTANPNMKISAADKTALINAWKSIDRNNMASKLANLSKAFSVAGWLSKVEKVAEKSIVGYETGKWGPLILEVESWVLSGITSALALAVLSGIVSTFLIAGSLPATVTLVAGTLGIVYVASLIDDKVAEKVNSQLIKAAW
ncbi:colicin-like pore-forming protein [Rouxiella badensis]|uniref:colicin-like pore-forming protein n=1 Tax=Rouxiella badensis TaxID=1646377 RepID=UPI0028D2BE55|nr:colicin-like pore-forming protein [Rouxiella badensis]